MTNPIAVLRDDFEDNSIAPTWTQALTAGGATLAEAAGQAVCGLPNNVAGTHQSYYRSAGLYDLTGDGFWIQIGAMLATGVAATMTFDAYLDASNVYRWMQSGGTIKAQKMVAGVTTDLYSASWSSSNHKYLRIREASGTVYFDSSTNGTSWTNRGSTTVASAFAVTALFIQFGAQCGQVVSPGQLKLDACNLILPALTTTWHATQVEWPLLERFRAITLAATSGQGYIATSNDGSTWRYFSGPLGSASGGYNALVEVASQAAAQAMAVNLPSAGRWDLPAIVECRYIKLFHRSTSGSSYTLREFYPRRLVQADDIEAESIRAMNIAAHTITADQIATVNLDATARVTAGGGATTLDNHGIRMLVATILTGGSYHSGDRSLDFVNAAGDRRGSIFTWDNSGTPTIEINAVPGAGLASSINLVANDDAGAHASAIAINAGAGANGRIYLTSDEIWLWNGLGATTAVTIAGSLSVSGLLSAAGGAAAEMTDAVTNATTDVLQIKHHSTGTPAANFGSAVRWLLEDSTTDDQSAAQINVVWANATHASRQAAMVFYTYDAGGAREFLRGIANGAAPAIGFLGAAAAAQQTGGAATAGGSYTATEQSMLQKAYNALRTFGLLS